MTKRKIWISWLLLMYFAVLFAERVQSIVRILINGIFFRDSLFDIYVNILTVLSLVATLVLLALRNKEFWKSLGGRGAGADYKMLSITAGVELLSGMVHTEFTIAPIQFAAYGALILAMGLETYENAMTSESAFVTWFNLVYATAFSMAIPVMYKSLDAGKTANQKFLFHSIEAITAIVLVIFFVDILIRIFSGRGNTLMRVVPIIFAAVCDAFLIVWRWNEEPNIFVLIFVTLSVLLFIVGRIVMTAIKRKA